jgi:hypothetical protein
MSSVLVVQVIVDEIVGVVSVRDGFVAAGRAVFVARVVRVAVVPAIAVLWIRARNWEDVFVDVRLVDVVQVSVMQIVDVSFMENGDVSASRRVRMAMIVVRFVFCHRWPRLVGSTSYLNCPHEGSTIGINRRDRTCGCEAASSVRHVVRRRTGRRRPASSVSRRKANAFVRRNVVSHPPTWRRRNPRRSMPI